MMVPPPRACINARRSELHPTFFDEQLGLVVGAIDYVRGS